MSDRIKRFVQSGELNLDIQAFDSLDRQTKERLLFIFKGMSKERREELFNVAVDLDEEEQKIMVDSFYELVDRDEINSLLKDTDI